MSKDKAEEKPYLQDLFEHMRNEHGLILLQSEMQEIIDICLKQTDYNSLSTSNTQLREALRELEEDTRFLPKVYRDMMLSISKAKQLLTDKE